MDVNSDFENTNKAYGQYAQSNSKTDKMEPVDNVNHPQHYQSKSGLETIDVIEAFTEDLMGSEATNTGNVLKYMCRWKSKNGLEDLKKAQWYLKRLIGIVGGREKRRSHQHVYMSTYEPKALDGSSYVFNKGEKK